MRREHASEVTRVNIFTHNGAPQALVGCCCCCYENCRMGAGVTWAEHWAPG